MMKSTTKGVSEMVQANNIDSSLKSPFSAHLFMDSTSFAIEKKFYEHRQLQG
jgi:hypothetical protein